MKALLLFFENAFSILSQYYKKALPQNNNECPARCIARNGAFAHEKLLFTSPARHYCAIMAIASTPQIGYTLNGKKSA